MNTVSKAGIVGLAIAAGAVGVAYYTWKSHPHVAGAALYLGVTWGIGGAMAAALGSSSAAKAAA